MFTRSVFKTTTRTCKIMIRGKATRWGIASAGKISSDYVKALNLLPKEEHQVVAVGSRKLEGSQAFAEKFNISQCYGSYEELANDKNVDIVYVGAINPAHVSLCQLMLNAGKHVLCEKPLGINLKQVKEMTDLARKKGVLLAEGFWSLHFPAWHQMKEEIAAGTVGQLKMITVNFGQDIIGKGSSRLTDRSLGGGALLDLGCYAVMAANDIFKEKPEKILASGLVLDTGVDAAAIVTLHYSGGRIAQLNIHAGAWLTNNLIVSGTTGSMELPSFWNASQLITPKKTFEFPLPEHSEKFTYLRSEGFVYEAQAIRESLIKGETENPRISLKDSETIIEIMDNIRKQLGVVYDVD